MNVHRLDHVRKQLRLLRRVVKALEAMEKELKHEESKAARAGRERFAEARAKLVAAARE